MPHTNVQITLKRALRSALYKSRLGTCKRIAEVCSRTARAARLRAPIAAERIWSLTRKSQGYSYLSLI